MFWLVVSTYPSEKYDESSVGMMTFPIYGKSKKNMVPNHQAVIISHLYMGITINNPFIFWELINKGLKKKHQPDFNIETHGDLGIETHRYP